MTSIGLRRISTPLFTHAAGALLVCCAILDVHQAFAQNADRSEHWVGTWNAAVVGRTVTPVPVQTQQPPPGPATQGPPVQIAQPPQPAPGGGGRGGPPAPPQNFSNQTLREIVHTSISGKRARVVLSNAFGTTPLVVGAAHLAIRDKDAAIVPGSGRALSFSERPSIAIPPGATVVSDPVELAVPPLSDVAVDLYLPGETTTASPAAMHGNALQTSYASPPGNHAGAIDMPIGTTTQSWFVLTRVEVDAAAGVGAIVVLGDSITDGVRSTPDANNRWPDHLARRLAARSSGAVLAVLNAGLGGNRLLSDGAPNTGVNVLARFDRDVLAQPGVTHVIVMEGINDIGMGATAPATAPGEAEIIAGYRQLIARAHARGLKIFGATLVPYEGAFYYTAEGEVKRQAVNEWIRSGRAYDAFFDFDKLLRDPNQPTKLLATYDSGDHLHPNDTGYQLMANAIDLDLFAPAPAR